MMTNLTKEEAVIRTVARWGQVQLSAEGVKMFQADLARLGFILIPIEPSEEAIEEMIIGRNSAPRGKRHPQPMREAYADLVKHERGGA